MFIFFVSSFAYFLRQLLIHILSYLSKVYFWPSKYRLGLILSTEPQNQKSLTIQLLKSLKFSYELFWWAVSLTWTPHGGGIHLSATSLLSSLFSPLPLLSLSSVSTTGSRRPLSRPRWCSLPARPLLRWGRDGRRSAPPPLRRGREGHASATAETAAGWPAWANYDSDTPANDLLTSFRSNYLDV